MTTSEDHCGSASSLDLHPCPLHHAHPSSTLVPLYLIPSLSSPRQSHSACSVTDLSNESHVSSAPTRDPCLLIFCVICQQSTEWYSPFRPSQQPSPTSPLLGQGVDLQPSFVTNKPPSVWVSGQIHGICAQCQAVAGIPSHSYQSSDQHTPSLPSKRDAVMFPKETIPLSPASGNLSFPSSSSAPLKLNHQALDTERGFLSSFGSSSQSGSRDSTLPSRLSFPAPQPQKLSSKAADHSMLNPLEVLKGSDLCLPPQPPIRLDLPLPRRPRRLDLMASHSDVKEVLNIIPESPNSSSAVQPDLHRRSSESSCDLTNAFSGGASYSRSIMTSPASTSIGSPDPGARLRSLLRQAKIPPPNSDQSSAVHQDNLRQSFEIWESALLSAAQERRNTHSTSTSDHAYYRHHRGHSISSNNSQFSNCVLFAADTALATGGDRGPHGHIPSQSPSDRVGSFEGAVFSEDQGLKQIFQTRRPSLPPNLHQSKDATSRRSGQGILGGLKISIERTRKVFLRRPALGAIPSSNTSLTWHARSISDHSPPSSLDLTSIDKASRMVDHEMDLERIPRFRPPNAPNHAYDLSNPAALQQTHSMSQPDAQEIIQSPTSTSTMKPHVRRGSQIILGRLMDHSERGAKEAMRPSRTSVESFLLPANVVDPLDQAGNGTSTRSLSSRPTLGVDPVKQIKTSSLMSPVTITSPSPMDLSTPIELERSLQAISSPPESIISSNISGDAWKSWSVNESERWKTSLNVPVAPNSEADPDATSPILGQRPPSFRRLTALSRFPPEKFHSASRKLSISIYPRPSSDTFHPGQRLTVCVHHKSETKRKMAVILSGKFVDRRSGTSHEFINVLKQVRGPQGQTGPRQSTATMEESVVELMIPEYATCGCHPGLLLLPSSGINFLGAVTYTIQLLASKKELIKPRDAISTKICVKEVVNPNAGNELVTRPMSARTSKCCTAFGSGHLGSIELYGSTFTGPI